MSSYCTLNMSKLFKTQNLSSFNVWKEKKWWIHKAYYMLIQAHVSISLREFVGKKGKMQIKMF